jgi:hypothetical protein
VEGEEGGLEVRDDLLADDADHGLNCSCGLLQGFVEVLEKGDLLLEGLNETLEVLGVEAV